MFLIEWESNELQYSYVFNLNKRKVTNKRYYTGKRKIDRTYALSGVYTDDGL